MITKWEFFNYDRSMLIAGSEGTACIRRCVNEGALCITKDTYAQLSVEDREKAGVGEKPLYIWWNVQCTGERQHYIAQFLTSTKRLTGADREMAFNLCAAKWGGGQ